MKKIGILMLVFLFCFAVTAWPQAQPQIGNVITFSVQGAGTQAYQGTFANGITSTGAVAGWYIDGNNVNHGFIRMPDGMITKVDDSEAGNGGGQGTLIQAMNCEGATTGYYVDSGNNTHSFLRTAYGKILNIDVPGALWTLAVNINAPGTVQGLYADANNNQHYFLRDADGNFTSFDAPSAGVGMSALSWASFNGLNDAGSAIGVFYDANGVFHSWLRTPEGIITRIDAPRAGTSAGQGTVTLGLGPQGSITGASADSTGFWNLFLLDVHGNYTFFGTPAPGNGGGVGEAVSLAGEIAGVCWASTGENYAFLRYPNGKVSEFGFPGAEDTLAVGINSLGWITGYVTDANFVTWSYVKLP